MAEWLVWAYLAAALLAWAVLWGWGDEWWLATIVLFSGRWLLLTPLFVLAPLAALERPALLGVLAIAAVVVLVPVMGLRLNLPASSDKGDAVRIMTLNAAGSLEAFAELPALIREEQIDVVAVQECPRAILPVLGLLTGWHANLSSGLCLLTRFPIQATAVMDRSAFEFAARSGYGGAGNVVRSTLGTPLGELHFTNLHLETPRKGFEGVMQRDDVGSLEANTRIRDAESRQAREWAEAAGGPFVVAGDFNTPVESRIYRRWWGELTNAFSARGAGFGMTKYNGWIRVRIDHVLVGPTLEATRAVVGPDVGSDHRPLIVDVERADR
jgi:endonuclease/exonuclease/phosphatase (EEP) superfamily protein YafD